MAVALGNAAVAAAPAPRTSEANTVARILNTEFHTVYLGFADKPVNKNAATVTAALLWPARR